MKTILLESIIVITIRPIELLTRAYVLLGNYSKPVKIPNRLFRYDRTGRSELNVRFPFSHRAGFLITWDISGFVDLSHSTVRPRYNLHEINAPPDFCTRSSTCFQRPIRKSLVVDLHEPCSNSLIIPEDGVCLIEVDQGPKVVPKSLPYPEIPSRKNS